MQMILLKCIETWSVFNIVRSVKDASFFRLKNLTLGYTLPRVWTEKANISKVRIYFSGDNLLTLTPYKGLDPERNGDGRDAIYPQNRIYSFGLNVEF